MMSFRKLGCITAIGGCIMEVGIELGMIPVTSGYSTLRGVTGIIAVLVVGEVLNYFRNRPIKKKKEMTE